MSEGNAVGTAGAGRDVLDFATGPISGTPESGGDVVQAVCDALS